MLNVDKDHFNQSYFTKHGSENMLKKQLYTAILLCITIGLSTAQTSYAQDADFGDWNRLGGDVDGKRPDSWNLQALLYSEFSVLPLAGTPAFLSFECREFGQPNVGLYLGFNHEIETETVALKYVTDDRANYFQDWKMNELGTGAGLWSEQEISNFLKDLEGADFVEFFAEVPTALGKIEHRANFQLQGLDAVWKDVNEVCIG